MADEKSLLKRAAKGDVDAFEALIVQYEKFIYNAAWRIMGNAEDAKDIAQEVAIKIFRNLSSVADIKHMRAWVARITHNACMDELRRRRGKTADSYDAMLDLGDAEVEREIADAADGPEALLLRQELAGQIEEGLRRLSDEHRALIVLRDVQGLQYEEIAEITQMPLGTVKSRISRGRRNLKQILLRMMEQK